MGELFDRAFAIVVGEEAGYVNDPADSGGETKFGISKRTYPDLDIKALTKDAAKAIYRRDFWDTCKCDSIPWPLAVYVFDAAVNQGASPAVRMLQRALDTAQDGILGVTTVRLAGLASPWHTARFMAFRAQRYIGTRNFDRFGDGWLTRLFEITQKAAEWAPGS